MNNAAASIFRARPHSFSIQVASLTRAGKTMNASRKIIMGTAALTLAASSAVGAGTDWPHTGHDAGGQRFSPLTQVNKANVNKLQPAWTYHLTPANYQGRPRLVEATPLVIGNTMVITSTN